MARIAGVDLPREKHIEYADSRYANQNPCTTVYRLVCQLLGRDEKLNVELIAKIECE